jgi:putative membrane protein
MAVDVAVDALIVASAILYWRGVAKLWRNAGVGRGIRVRYAASFVVGWAALAAAFLPPVGTLAEESFAMHMVQHEILMVVAAPLLVLARALEAWTWATPLRARAALSAAARVRSLRAVARWLADPVIASCLHAIAVWIWHMPALFVAASENEALHFVQHASFFFTAVAFWRAVLGCSARVKPLAVACLFVTMLQTAALGGLLTFAPTPWYAHDGAMRVTDAAALADQQLGGLLMWVPGGLPYVLAALGIAAAWLSGSRTPRRIA